MPGYVTASLLSFRHQLKHNKELSPHHHVAPTCGAKVKYAEPEDDAPLLPEERINFIQKVVGVFLYYAIAIDNTVLVALSDIGSEQSRIKFKTMDEVQQLPDYLASNPNATICFRASGMILFIHSDASYLSVTKPRSRASGVFSLSDTKGSVRTQVYHRATLFSFFLRAFVRKKYFKIPSHFGFSNPHQIFEFLSQSDSNIFG